MQNWILYDEDEQLICNLAAELKINPLTASLLTHRGISTAEDAKKFLYAETAQEFYDPFSMKGMPDAVDRIDRAIKNREKLVVYGDYDVDGMTASTIMLKTLRRLGADVDSYIPSRQNEGYGFNIPALEFLSENYNLLISVDCGITNNAEIDAVAGQIDIIVTDHHLPIEPLEHVIAAIDPHQPDCPYPEKNLCGAGVAFKLCQALDARLNNSEFGNYVEDIELAALATVADMVPLLGENRKIVRLGLKRMNETKNIGLRELINVSGLADKKITAGHCGFSLGPRLNAIGRLESASSGVELLTTDDPVKARQIALKLDRENTKRKQLEEEMLRAADEEFQKRREACGGGLSSIIIAKDGWHAGVIGLTASKLVEKYNLPTIVIALKDDLAVGSCRSIPALHIKDALDHFGDRFLRYGGHAAAAGFSMRAEYVERFIVDFDEYVGEKLRDEDFIPTQKIDAEIHPTLINLKLAEELQLLAPFGIGNQHPKFAWRSVKGKNARAMGGNGQHLTFEIESSTNELQLPPDDTIEKVFGDVVDNNLVETPQTKYIGVDEIDELSAAFGEEGLDEIAEAFGDSEFQADRLGELEEDEAPDGSDDKLKVRAVGWSMGALAPLVNEEPIDIVFEPSVNEYNGEKSVQCMINSLEPSGMPDQFPSRAELGRIYKFLRSQSKSGMPQPFDICKLTAAFRRSTVANAEPKLNSIYTLSSAMQIFAEIGLMHFDADGKNFFMPVPKGKFDLNRSRIFKLNNEGADDER